MNHGMKPLFKDLRPLSQALPQSRQLQRWRLDAALERIQRGNYGICCACAGPISLACLLSDPAAAFCFDCQSERDAEHETTH
ncbi:MAG: TraR/DksA family transcriptional regulator [Inhella sp.]